MYENRDETWHNPRELGESFTATATGFSGITASSAPFDDAWYKSGRGLTLFAFSDADKEWYPQYFKDLDAKIRVNGCFVAHNVLRSWAPQMEEFLDYVKARPNYGTRIERGSGEGISISCKTAE
jgi:hypothetical protein